MNSTLPVSPEVLQESDLLPEEKVCEVCGVPFQEKLGGSQLVQIYRGKRMLKDNPFHSKIGFVTFK